MKERPILMAGRMAQLCFTGEKTVTRRVVKPQRSECEMAMRVLDALLLSTILGREATEEEVGVVRPCPCGVPGDRLWVRETWWMHDCPRAFDSADGNVTDDNGQRRLVGYAASMDYDSVQIAKGYGCRKRPSIHMPRWACRTVLEVVKVRVERLQEISDLDLLAEGWPGAAEVARGCEGPEAFPFQGVTRGDLLRGGIESPDTAVEWFADLWDSLYGEGSWEANPWVWVVEFRKV